MHSENGNVKLESKLNVSLIQIVNNNNKNKNTKCDKSEKKSLSYKCSKCVLDSFELNYGPLTEDCKDEILKKPTSFMWKHFFDFWASFLLITPCIISFWRGTWDYAVIYLEKKAFNVCIRSLLKLISMFVFIHYLS
jgi:hypothetical protein